MDERLMLRALVGLAIAELAACSAVLNYDDVPPSTTTTTSSAQGGGGSGGTATGGSNSGGQTTTSGSGGTGGAACPDMGDPCFTCGAEQCPEVYCACVTNWDCIALSGCVSACPDPPSLDCLQPCYAAHTASVSQGALVNDCLGDNCSASCPGFAPSTPCRHCLYQSCPAQMNACLADPDCAHILFCADACLDSGCLASCVNTNPGGEVLAGSVQQCAAVSCGSECPWAMGPSPDSGG